MLALKFRLLAAVKNKSPLGKDRPTVQVVIGAVQQPTVAVISCVGFAQVLVKLADPCQRNSTAIAVAFEVVMWSTESFACNVPVFLGKYSF